MRAAGNAGKVDDAVRTKVLSLVNDPSPNVRLQTTIAAPKIQGVDPIPTLLASLERAGDDALIPHIVWQNLSPLLEDHAKEFVSLLEKTDLGKSPNVAALMPRIAERILGRKQSDPALIATLFGILFDAKGLNPDVTRAVFGRSDEEATDRRNRRAQATALGEKFATTLQKVLAGKPDGPLYLNAATLAATLKNPTGLAATREIAASVHRSEGDQLKASSALISVHDPVALHDAGAILSNVKANPERFRSQVLDALAGLDRSGRRGGRPQGLPDDGAGLAAAGHRVADAAHGVEQTAAGGRRRQEDSGQRDQHQPSPQADGQQRRERNQAGQGTLGYAAHGAQSAA